MGKHFTRGKRIFRGTHTARQTAKVQQDAQGLDRLTLTRHRDLLRCTASPRIPHARLAKRHKTRRAKQLRQLYQRHSLTSGHPLQALRQIQDFVETDKRIPLQALT